MSLRSRLGKGIASAGLIASDALSKYFASQQQAEQKATENAQEERRLKIAEELGAFNLKKGASDLLNDEAARAQTEAETAEKKRLAGLESLGQADISALGMEKVSKPAPIAAGFDRAAPRTEISPEEFAGRFQGERERIIKDKPESQVFTMAAGASGSLPSKTSKDYLESLQRSEAEANDLEKARLMAGNRTDARQGLDEQRKFQKEQALRGQFDGMSKDYIAVRDAYKRVSTSQKNPSPAGDLAMIFNYMKMLDPGSVVREAEFATAAATGDYGERIQAAVKKVTSGQRLTDEQRQDFLNSSRNLYNEQRQSFQNLKSKYDKQAQVYGLDPEGVTGGIDFDIEAPGPGNVELSTEDQEALDWANENSSDPRAAAIKKRLGK